MSWRGRQQLKCDEQYNYKYQNNDNKNNNNNHNNDNTPYKDDWDTAEFALVLNGGRTEFSKTC